MEWIRSLFLEQFHLFLDFLHEDFEVGFGEFFEAHGQEEVGILDLAGNDFNGGVGDGLAFAQLNGAHHGHAFDAFEEDIVFGSNLIGVPHHDGVIFADLVEVVLDDFLGGTASDGLGFAVNIFVIEVTCLGINDGEAVEGGFFLGALDEKFAVTLVGELAAVSTEVAEELAEVHALIDGEAFNKHLLGERRAHENGAGGVERFAQDLNLGISSLGGDLERNRTGRFDLVLDDAFEGILCEKHI